MDTPNNFANKIIVALDVDTGLEALRLTDKLPETEVFKVGLKLFTAEGPSVLHGRRGGERGS